MAIVQSSYQTEESIFAPATPALSSAIGVIRLSGGDLFEKFEPLFSRPKSLKKAEGHTLLHGILRDPKSKEEIDEILLAVFREPRSYTGENSLEIHCHGGVAVQRRILTLLAENEIREAAPGEFTLRAFLNNKLDLTEAEGIHELITAQSDSARRLAFDRSQGSLSQRLKPIREGVLSLLAQVEVQLDYPEDELGEIFVEKTLFEKSIEGLQRLLASYQTGRRHQEGVSLILAGRTNSGKSSLFNLFLKEERSIVSQTHGTTRDYIESHLLLRDVFVRLYDTAGFRELEEGEENSVELEGIRRTSSVIETGDLVLFLLDGSRELTEEERVFYDKHCEDPRYLFLVNKVDLAPIDAKPLEKTLPLSALSGEGFSALEEKILERLDLLNPSASGEPFIQSTRQKILLEESLEGLSKAQIGYEEDLSLDLVALHLQEAREALGILTGEITNEEVLDQLFSQFCLGK